MNINRGVQPGALHFCGERFGITAHDERGQAAVLTDGGHRRTPGPGMAAEERGPAGRRKAKTAEVEDRLGAQAAPALAGAFGALADDGVAARLNDAGGDGQAAGGEYGIVQASRCGVVLEVLAGVDHGFVGFGGCGEKLGQSGAHGVWALRLELVTEGLGPDVGVQGAGAVDRIGHIPHVLAGMDVVQDFDVLNTGLLEGGEAVPDP